MKKCLIIFALTICFQIQSFSVMALIPPTITFTTTATGPFSFKSTAPTDTIVQIDWGDGILTNYVVGNYTAIESPADLTGPLTEVKVYNPTITGLYLEVREVASLDVSNCAGLTHLFCTYGKLDNLDVSYNTALKYLTCFGNNLTNLNLSSNTLLEGLSCGNNQITSLDLSANTALSTLGCSDNPLGSLDVSANTALTEIECTYNNLSSLDVNANTALTRLNCSGNSLTSLNISSNIALIALSCDDNLLETLDVSQQIVLEELSFSWNKISDIHLSANVNLTTLNCSSNLLTNLDVSTCSGLNSLNCSNNDLKTLELSASPLSQLFCSENKLTFATLPQRTATCWFYNFAPQDTFGIYPTGNIIDFSAMSTAKDIADVYQTTSFTWVSGSGDPLQEGVDYAVSNGVFTFLKIPEEVIICEMTNNAFPGLTLNTSYIDPFHFIFDCALSIPEYFSVTRNGNALDNSDIVKTGDTLTFTAVHPSGYMLGSFKVNGVESSSRDTLIVGSEDIVIEAEFIPPAIIFTTTATGPFEFVVTTLADNTGIYIDWGNGELIAKTVGSSYSVVSSPTNLANPSTEIRIFSQTIKSLDVTDKQIIDIDVSACNTLQFLIINWNHISQLDVRSNTLLTYLECNANEIDTLLVDGATALQLLHCNANNLAFNTLPQKRTTYTAYEYFNQKNINVFPVNNKIDLSDQLVAKDIDDVERPTNYTWKTRSGEILTEGIDYTNSIGIFTFLRLPNDTITCEMTNAAFPDITLYTEEITPVSFQFDAILTIPENVVVTRNGIELAESDKVVTGEKMVITVHTPAGYMFGSLKVNGVEFASGDTLIVATDFVVIEATFIEPAIIFTTTATGSFSVNLSAVEENTPIKIDWGNGIMTDYLLNQMEEPVTSPMDLTGTTTEVRVFGSDIKTFRAESKIITNLDVSSANELYGLYCYDNQMKTLNIGTAPALKHLSCSKNMLSSLDLSGAANLTLLSCSYNQLTSLNLNGKNALQQLYCSYNQLTSLNVSSNTALIYLECNDNQLESLDVSSNSLLGSLSCGNNQLISLKTEGTNALTQLFCMNNRLTDLNLSTNTSLKVLGCGDNLLTDLDVSANTQLQYLSCENNLLSSLSIETNTSLSQLICYGNLLDSLDVSLSSTLTHLYCDNNYFTFSTLPKPKYSYWEYTYSMQAEIIIAPVDNKIDLSGQWMVKDEAGIDQTTLFIWKNMDGSLLTKDVDYKESDGMFDFMKIPSDSVYCEMVNPAFPNLVLSTKRIAPGAIIFPCKLTIPENITVMKNTVPLSDNDIVRTGDTLTITANAPAGYINGSLKVNDIDFSIGSTYVVSDKDVIITATFNPIGYTLTIPEYVMVSCNGVDLTASDQVYIGDELIITVDLPAQFIFDSLTVNGLSLTSGTMYKVGAGNVNIVIVYDLPTRLTETLPGKIEVYPNPFTSLLFLRINDVEVMAVEMVDMLGNTQVFTSGLSGEINTSDIKPGVYLVKITTEDGVAVKRMIKR